jgi:hypothetical protein
MRKIKKFVPNYLGSATNDDEELESDDENMASTRPNKVPKLV